MSDSKSAKKSFLTPCRTVGLKRKSLRSPAILNHSKNSQTTPSPSPPVSASKETKSSGTPTMTSSNDASKREIINKLELGSENHVNGTSVTRTTPAEHSAKQTSIFSNVALAIKMHSQINVTSMDLENVSVADLDFQIGATMKSITVKIGKIKERESDLANVKQHNLETLNNLIRKWRAACQEALNELFAEYEKQGKPCSMSILLNTLGISSRLVHYSETEMDFYE